MTKIARHFINLPQQFALGELLRSQYEAKALGDPGFAAFAQETLGFKITTSNVGTVREALGITSTRNQVHGKADLADLRKRVAALEARIDVHFNTGK